MPMKVAKLILPQITNKNQETIIRIYPDKSEHAQNQTGTNYMLDLSYKKLNDDVHSSKLEAGRRACYYGRRPGCCSTCCPSCKCLSYCWVPSILVPRGHDPFGQHQESRPLAAPNTGSPWWTDSLFKSDKFDWLKTTERVLFACSKIGSGQRSRFLMLTKGIVASVGDSPYQNSNMTARLSGKIFFFFNIPLSDSTHKRFDCWKKNREFGQLC